MSIGRLLIPAGLALPAVASAPAGAEVWKVPEQFATIQQAIDAARDGDEILVGDGVYSGPGNYNLDFAGRTLLLRSEGGARACTIDALGLGRAFVFRTGETTDAVIEGFTITNGNAWAADPDLPEGGAVLCELQSAATFRSCVFVNNQAYAGGAVMARWYSHPIFEECRFLDNRGDYAGALGAANFSSPRLFGCLFRGNAAGIGGAITGWFGWYFEFDTPTIRRCAFIGNSAVEHPAMDEGGGAWFFFRSHPIVDRCVFEGNAAAGPGGAISQYKSNPVVRSSLFVQNAAEWGGAIFNNPFSVPLFVNCTIVDNAALLQGGGVWGANLNTELDSCIVWGNVTASGDGDQIWGNPLVSHSNVQGGFAGVGNEDLDPLFRDPEAGDYRLSGRSPCINTADPWLVDFYEPWDLDLEGDPRILCEPDRGADEVALPGCEPPPPPDCQDVPPGIECD